MSLEQSLLLGLWQAHLTTAARMVRIGNYPLAAAELRRALTVLDQLSALTPAPPPINPILPLPPIDL